MKKLQILTYFKLCILVTKDYETAKSLAPGIISCFDDILNNFHRLWITENRDVLSDRFLNSFERKRDAFLECLKSI